MTARAELTRRATEHGVAVSYYNWRGKLVEVPDETLAAVLGVLSDGGPSAGSGAGGAAGARGADGLGADGLGAKGRGAGADDTVAPFPARRSWGFTVQLYSVRSRASWGHGDLRDLADLAAWSGRDLGADFVLVNPLHAAEPLPPISPSPYLAMTRRQVSPLYLRIEDIAEYEQLSSGDRARVETLAEPLRAASATAALIDRDAVWDAKRQALELIRAVPLQPERQAELDAFRAREGRAVQSWATWCTIAEAHGPDWRTWPAALADPASGGVAGFRREHAERVDFHVWLQWLVTEQAAVAQRAAKAAGMSIGVIADLAVGAHPGGADAWAYQDVIVPDMSVGAPPDEFNQLGQDWTLPPWHPGWLAAEAGRPLGELIAATTRNVGGMRVDHVMGLARLWWIPAGMSPGMGTYVRYDHELLGGVVAAEVARADALAIGEDLGTVDEYPNWRIPLTGSDGKPVLLEDLPDQAGVRAAAAAVAGGLHAAARR